MDEENKVVEEQGLPEPRQKGKPAPKRSKKPKELPQVGNPENTVKIGDTLVEIKPTKLKYHRDNTAYFYRIVTNIPLPDIMAMPQGAFGDDRDGDKALYDWLVAATDNEDLIRENYNEMDTGDIEKILEIFRRINHIDEKELAQKNVMSQVERE